MGGVWRPPLLQVRRPCCPGMQVQDIYTEAGYEVRLVAFERDPTTASAYF